MSDATRVPRLNLKPQIEGARSELDAAIARVLDRGQFIRGEEVARFEASFSEHAHTEHAIGCASGTDALLLSLMALDIGAGDQVICPAYSFFASAGVIARLGATPVFADIAPDTFALDPASLERAAARCTSLRAVIVVHLFGRMAETAALREIAERHGAVLVHDAAQAVGALDEAGEPAGASGELTAFSFYPSKNLGAFGDAGAVTTRDDTLASRIRTLAVHGATAPYQHDSVGINSRLDELQAAILNVRLKHLAAGIESRRACADDYDSQLAGCPELQLPSRPGSGSRARHGFHQYTVRLSPGRRDGLLRHLAEGGIDSAVYYPVPLHQQPCFAAAGKGPPPSLPEAEAAARETLALPIYPELPAADRTAIAERTQAFLARAAAESKRASAP